MGRLRDMDEPRWLDAAEQGHWRAYLEGSSRLWERLDRDLKAAHGLTMPEYEILVRLSEAPGRRLRMAELAAMAYQSRSRLSHTCSRLENKGLVRREACPDDKRGINAVLTDEGFAVLEQAAKSHVQTVRAHLIDLVSPEELEVIGKAFTRIAARAE
ncbi:MarR family transcriptional regulator [Actinocorallia aurantiaca]|uniref:MarR family transcriptional regulator n=2 Tax=Actinocorallia aurantiaca TaxID=46204 RepID=A0ABP6G7Y5_9ACTN